MLAAARLRYVAGSRWGTRRYMDMDRLKEMEEAESSTADKKNRLTHGSGSGVPLRRIHKKAKDP